MQTAGGRRVPRSVNAGYRGNSDPGLPSPLLRSAASRHKCGPNGIDIDQPEDAAQWGGGLPRDNSSRGV